MPLEMPAEFDPKFYSQIKPYLAGNSPEFLKREFELYGKKSGAPGSYFCYRSNVVQVFSKIGGNILEIGPGLGPDFTGENVKYLDIVDSEELRKLYPELPERNGGAPEINYLISDLAEGRITEKFNLVYSAHNLEHQANCVTHLNSIADILKPGGYFVAAIPDRKFTFDYYRPTSTLIDILAAPKSQTHHSLRALMSSQVTTHNNSALHWLNEHGESELSDDFALDAYLKGESDNFESKHVYTFEPDIFRSIFSALSRKKIIKLELLRVYNTPIPANEFMAIFQKPL